MKTIIVLNSYYYVKTQIKNLMSPHNVEVLGATNSIGLYNLMDSLENKIDLLLIDINLSGEDAFMIMKRIRETHVSLPMVIVTTVGKRDQFIKGVQHGAVDYILLPLNEEDFMTRTMKHLQLKNMSTKNVDLNSKQPDAKIDFQQYLSHEFKRAVKGKYSLSIVMCTFFKTDDEFNEKIENEYIVLNNYLYNEFKSLFWDTDLFVKYGSHSFIGIFPFSDEKNTVIILSKIEKAFEIIKVENKKYEQYNLENVFVTYPIDASSQDSLLENLSEKMKNTILNVKNNIIE